jgi:hypothetical protein
VERFRLPWRPRFARIRPARPALLDLTPLERSAAPLAFSRRQPYGAMALTAQPPTAAERILAAEMAGRGESDDALSMMVASIARMVQAGKTRDSRWKSH